MATQVSGMKSEELWNIVDEQDKAVNEKNGIPVTKTTTAQLPSYQS